MDELFEHFKNTHPKHKYLLSGLILTEILGILVLFWYLKEPIKKQYLTNPPKAYSIESYDPQKRYIVRQGDFLRGDKALPYSKIAVFITPGKSKQTIKAGRDGEFQFQIPEDLSTGKFRVTFANYDALKNIAWIKSYKLTVDSNSIFNLKNLNLKTANAQGL